MSLKLSKYKDFEGIGGGVYASQNLYFLIDCVGEESIQRAEEIYKQVLSELKEEGISPSFLEMLSKKEKKTKRGKKLVIYFAADQESHLSSWKNLKDNLFSEKICINNDGFLGKIIYQNQELEIQRESPSQISLRFKDPKVSLPIQKNFPPSLILQSKFFFLSQYFPHFADSPNRNFSLNFFTSNFLNHSLDIF